ncbi:MAG TPA: type II secretion system protein [Rhodocyclaceae bacterium]|nr:type II secretion system protein [Rhodocyclaceae bacterium]
MARGRGFTLVEMVVVIVITGILAASFAVFFVPAVNSYFDSKRRAELTDAADTALRRMGRDVRRAVPNSIRIPSNQCFELVPTKAGGLYRRATDIVNANSDPLDTSGTDTSFDVLSPLAANPASGDFVVIGNQNTNDVYAGTNRGSVSGWASPPSPGGAAVGVGRVTLNPAAQFPAGYDGARFQIVDGAEQSVFYICRGAGTSSGNGTGQLVRLVRAFNATYPAACPAAGGAVLANNVAACEFIYNPNQGATQQSGFVWMRIELLSAGERMALSSGVHVSNVP